MRARFPPEEELEEAAGMGASVASQSPAPSEDGSPPAARTRAASVALPQAVPLGGPSLRSLRSPLSGPPWGV
jgi:hypothetical protein